MHKLLTSYFLPEKFVGAPYPTSLAAIGSVCTIIVPPVVKANLLSLLTQMMLTESCSFHQWKTSYFQSVSQFSSDTPPRSGLSSTVTARDQQTPDDLLSWQLVRNNSHRIRLN